MNLITEFESIINQLKIFTQRIDTIDFQNTRYRQEIKYAIARNPELKDFFSDATKKEAGVDI